MQLINQTIDEIKGLGYASSAYTLAEALASACSATYSVSLLNVSAVLDASNRDLVVRLSAITLEPDYSNASQDEVLQWLRLNDYIK